MKTFKYIFVPLSGVTETDIISEESVKEGKIKHMNT